MLGLMVNGRWFVLQFNIEEITRESVSPKSEKVSGL